MIHVCKIFINIQMYMYTAKNEHVTIRNAHKNEHVTIPLKISFQDTKNIVQNSACLYIIIMFMSHLMLCVLLKKSTVLHV